MRWHVISAVFARNFKQYFSGVLGYLFIVVFVMVCAIMTFSEQFFADNLTNLDQLSRWFPAVLLVFVPAITMNVWADERRQGTDAILFTLPASDLEITLGKYLAVAAVYTVALLFSSTQLIALWVIGSPDWGVVLATYLGYWLAGLALLSIGMFASALTGSVPVAFVLGALFCATPVYVGRFLTNVPRFVEQLRESSPDTALSGFFGMEQLGIDWNLQDFTLGLIPLANVFYFGSIMAFMLYLNLVVISKRHWSRGQQVSLGGQFAIRIASLAVALLSLNFMVNQMSSSLMSRIDLTAQRLYTLDPSTIATLAKAREQKKKVSIQAYVSRDVPRSYVNTKKQLTGLLRQFQYYGGNYVEVNHVDVLPNSDRENEAQQQGIEPRADRSEIGGRIVEQDVYLGAVVIGPQDNTVLPFIDNDTSIEYQLTHAIATTTDKSRRITLGILDTDTFFAGPEIEGRRIQWAYNNTYSYLKTQFRIKHIKQDDLGMYVEDQELDAESSSDDEADPHPDADSESPQNRSSQKPKEVPDVLLVADPSSLSDLATEALLKYLQAGHPVIFLADPLPFFWTSMNPESIGVINAPRQPRISPRSPYAQILSSSFAPKADDGSCRQILDLLGIEWNHGRVTWNLYDPHPNFKGNIVDQRGQTTWPSGYGPYEHAFVFVKDHGNHRAFNSENDISNGLKELLFMYPGSIRAATESQTTLIPLVSLERESGTTDWDDLTLVPVQTTNRFNPRTGQITQHREKQISPITSDELRVLNPAPPARFDDVGHVLAAHIKGTESNPINAVWISDLDFVSDLYHEQISESGLNQKLDNVTFLQNAIEVLAGVQEFVPLRNRRPEPRTLVYLERETEQYRLERAKAQEKIEQDIRQQLQQEQNQLDEQAKKIEGDQSLSFFEKLQRTSQEASDAQRRFNLKKEKLDRQLKIDIDKLRIEEQDKIRKTESFVKWLAIGFAPLPAFLLGCGVFAVRRSNERNQIKASRRVS